MDVCNFDYSYLNNLNIKEKNPCEVKPIWNWSKIGEVYSNTQSQCLIICTICIGYGQKFDNAYTTNDASAFWNHIQAEHKDYDLLNGRTAHDKYNKNEQNGSSCGGRNATERNYNTNATVLPHEKILESNTDKEQLQEDRGYRHETEVHIDDVLLPEMVSNESHLPDSNNCSNHIVDISDDEDGSSNARVFVQHDQNNVENDNAIEVSDDEEYVRSEQTATTLIFQSRKLYKCEKCGELFIDQDTMDEHKKSHELHKGLFVSAEIPRTIPQHSDSTTTGSNLNDDDLQNHRCRFCSITFCTIKQLEQHQAVHISRMDDQEQNDSLNTQCRTCGERFSSIDFLRSHEQSIHHFGIDLELTNCVHCQKIVSESNLELHISADHKKMDYLTTRHLLLPNTITPPQTRPYKCTICGIRTTTSSAMVKHHRRYHSATLDPSTANCEVCNKLVLTRNMTVHMVGKHGKGTGIKCPHCSRCYKSRSSFRIHMTKSHSICELPPNSTVEDSLSSASTTTQSDFTTEESAEYSNSSYQMNIETFSDELNVDEESISYGELIPMNISVPDC